MTLEEYIKQFPGKVTQVILDYGALRSETVDVPSERWNELKKAKKEDMGGLTLRVLTEG